MENTWDETDLNPRAILFDPLINKGSAFTQEERDLLGLHGLLPSHISTIEEQVERRYHNFCDQTMEIGRYIFLSALHDRNETLFFRLVYEHIEEMLPYIYTPIVGEVSQQFSFLYHQTRGIYFSYPSQEKISQIVDNIYLKDIDAIVITDGSRILGLGDLGIGGMAIPVGKLALYTLFGGISPDRTLPITLDVGTDNEKLLQDPLYLGWREKRISGKEYDDFVDHAIQSIKKRFPHVLLQWEDFSKPHAWELLHRYKDQICSFNDDIQGTAAVAFAGILAAVKAKREKLSDQRIAILGGGSAGMGIAELLKDAMQLYGTSSENIYIIDIHGLIHDELDFIEPEHKPYAQPKKKIHTWNIKDPKRVTLLDVIENAHPTILIGVTGQPGAFTEEIVKKMAKFVKRPIIFPLSNPTSRAEATPQQILVWTEGEAIIATGSPFAQVTYQGKNYPIAQCNNVYIFPGVGLGAIISKSTKITQKMFLKAAEILSDHAPILKNDHETLFPKFTQLRAISAKIAQEVAQIAIDEKLIREPIKKDLSKMIEDYMWFPTYKTFKRFS